MPANSNHPRAHTADRQVVISRVFDSPPELLWKSWTQPKYLGQWWGPATSSNPLCEMDAREGGAYRIVMRGPDGLEYPIRGNFRELSAPQRLVLTMDCSEHPASWHDLVNPARGANPNPAGEILATVTFTREAERTRLTIRLSFASVAIREAMVKMGLNEGWSQSLDRLRDLLGAMTA